MLRECAAAVHVKWQQWVKREAVTFVNARPPARLNVGLIARALECRQAAADPDTLFSARRTLLSQIDACASLFTDEDDLLR